MKRLWLLFCMVVIGALCVLPASASTLYCPYGTSVNSTQTYYKVFPVTSKLARSIILMFLLILPLLFSIILLVNRFLLMLRMFLISVLSVLVVALTMARVLSLKVITVFGYTFRRI